MPKVACTVLNGITICKWKPGYDDGTGDGMKPMVKDGPPLRLNGPGGRLAGAGNSDGGVDLPPVVTEVPDDWGFDRWLEQNKENPFVTEGLIKLVQVEEERVPNEA